MALPHVPMTLCLLPTDLLTEVMRYCSGLELASLSITSKYLRKVALDDQLWVHVSAAAFTWKPELANVVRKVATIETPWLRNWTHKWAPALQLPHPQQPLNGVEQLMARTGKRLRLLQMETRHAEVYFQEECFAICILLLYAWLEGQSQLDADLIDRLRCLSNKFLRHVTVAMRVLSTIIADTIALRLRLIMPLTARQLGGSQMALESMWEACSAASDAVCNWADVIARADPPLAASEECGLPLVLAAQAVFRSQVLLAYPIQQLLGAPLTEAALSYSLPAEIPQWIVDAQQVVRTHGAPHDELRRFWFNRESAGSAKRFSAAYHMMPSVALQSANIAAASLRPGNCVTLP